MDPLPTEETGDAFIADLHARRRPRLFVISGPSGVGKDTLIDRLREEFPDIHFSVTATTRTRRPSEIDGVHYFFLERQVFEQKLSEGEFLEHAVVYNHLYGVPRSPLRHALARGQDVIVKIDVQGAESIRKIAPNATFIFIAPESMTALFQRLRSRKTDDLDILMTRFAAASRELLQARKFDYVVFNESERVDSALDQVRSIIATERLRANQTDILI